MTVTLEEQIYEVQRELAMRESCYPRWVRNGQMKQPQAGRQLTRMKAVLQTLAQLSEKANADQLDHQN